MAVADEEQAGSDPVTDGTVDRIDAFVSYRRSPEDTAFVDELQDALTARGKHVWIDRAEIEPASDWSARIDRGIRSARAFIFVITAESVISRECLRELQAAVDLRKLIIPVLPQDLGPMTGLPESLTRPNWIFFTDRQGRPNERATDQVIQALDEDLPWRDAHTRLAVRAQEWAGADRDRSFLLHGSDLHQAEEWLQGAAQHQQTPPTALQTEYIVASRKATVRTQRTWRVALSAGLVVALILAGVAFIQRNTAQTEARVAQSRALAAEATANLSSDPEQSVSEALSAVKTDQTSSAEQALRLSLAQDQLRMVIQSGTGSATKAAWNPVRSQVAVTAPHNSVALWNTATGRLTTTLPLVHAGAVNQLFWDGAGTRLAAVSATGYVSMWNVPTSGAATTIATGALNTLIQSDSDPSDWTSLVGQLLAGGWRDRDGTEFYVWGTTDNVPVLDPATGRVHPLFRNSLPSYETVANVAPSPDGTRLLVDAGIVDLTTGQQTLLSPQPAGGPSCWLPDGSAVVTSTTVQSGGPQEFYRASNGKQFASMRTPVGPTQSVGCSANAAYPWAASGDGGGNVVIRLGDGTVLPLAGHDATIEAIASSPDGRYLATASDDGTARIWDASTGQLVTVLTDGTGLTSVQFGATDGYVLTVDSSGLLRIWGTGAGQQTAGLQLPSRGQTMALRFTGSGQQISGVNFTTSTGSAAAITGASALTWDAGTGRLSHQVALPGLEPSAVPCSAALRLGSGMLTTSGSDCHLPPPSDLTLGIPVARSIGPGLSTPELEVVAVATSQDGRYIAYARRGSVAVLSATGHLVAALPTGSTPTGLSFIGTSDRLLVMTARDIDLWTPGSGQRPLVIRPASQPVDATVSGSGAVLAAAETNGKVEVWSAEDGHHRHTLRTVKTASESYYTAAPLRVALSPSGDVVASGDADGTVFLWQVSTAKRLAIRRVSTWPIVELSSVAGAARMVAVDYAQAGTGVNPPGAADVINTESGQVVAVYQSPAPPSYAPVDPAATLSADGDFLFGGALGLAPTAPGGAEATYEIAGGQLVAAMRTGAQPADVAYSELAPWPWSPDQTRVLAGNQVYACDACGDLAELRAVAASRAAWDRPLSAADDHPPATSPYR